jgi:hypothetical protein
MAATRDISSGSRSVKRILIYVMHRRRPFGAHRRTTVFLYSHATAPTTAHPPRTAPDRPIQQDACRARSAMGDPSPARDRIRADQLENRLDPTTKLIAESLAAALHDEPVVLENAQARQELLKRTK